MSEGARRQEVAGYARRLHAAGWVANHDGNVTVRLAGGRYLATPTAFSKADVTPDTLLVVDDAGARVSGRTRPFSELGLHLAVYRARPDVGAVVHAHPPTATGFAAAGLGLEEPFLAEAVVSLGPRVPLVPFAAPGPAAGQALGPFLREHDAVLLAGNGVLTWGTTLEQAYLRMELVEHLCKVALVARQLGGVQPLPASALPALLEARARAGLGPRGRGEAAPSAPPPATKTVIACAPPPPGADVEVRQPTSDRQKLAEIIRQEIAAALRR